MAKRNLIEIIRQNPNAVAIVDNDCWFLYAKHPDSNPYDYEEEDQEDIHDKWDEDNQIASSDDTFVPRLGDGGYGSGNCYGGDLLQALAQIVGMTVESV